jgi:hypothetical protein
VKAKKARTMTVSAKKAAAVCVNIVLVLVGVIIGSAIPRDRAHDDPTEILPEFKQEVDQMFRRYQNGEVVYYRNLPVFSGTLKCAIVENRVAGAEYGFASAPGDLERIWYVTRGYQLKNYQDGILLVIVREKFAHEMDRDPATSRVQPP